MPKVGATRLGISPAIAPFPTPLFSLNSRPPTVNNLARFVEIGLPQMWKQVETNEASQVREMKPADFLKHEEENPKMVDSTCSEVVGPKL